MGDELPELPATPRTQLYNAEVLDRGLETFEREGLWLPHKSILRVRDDDVLGQVTRVASNPSDHANSG